MISKILATQADMEAGYDTCYLTFETPAGAVHEKDIIFGGRHAVRSVDVSPRADKVTIKIDGRHEGRSVYVFTKDTTVTVMRRVLSEAGQMDKEDARLVERYHEHLKRAKDAVTNARLALVQDLERPYQTSSHFFTKLMEADAWLYILAGVEHIRKDFEDGKEVGQCSEIEGLERAVGQYSENLLNRWTHKGESQSSSRMSNLQADVENEMTAKFIDIFGRKHGYEW